MLSCGSIAFSQKPVCVDDTGREVCSCNKRTNVGCFLVALYVVGSEGHFDYFHFMEEHPRAIVGMPTFKPPSCCIPGVYCHVVPVCAICPCGSLDHLRKIEKAGYVSEKATLATTMPKRTFASTICTHDQQLLATFGYAPLVSSEPVFVTRLPSSCLPQGGSRFGGIWRHPPQHKGPPRHVLLILGYTSTQTDTYARYNVDDIRFVNTHRVRKVILRARGSRAQGRT